MPCMRCTSVMLSLLFLTACASRHAVRAEPRSADELAQPALRILLDDLAGLGIVTSDTTVFVLGHWILDDRDDAGDVNRRRFEGAPFEHEGARVFVTIGPINQYWKKPSLPAEDRIIPAPADERGGPGGATIQLAGQDWTIGFAMKDGTPALQDRLSKVLLEWGQRYRDARGFGG